MELFIQQLFNALMMGSTFAIVALGLTLVFGILRIPNFAHGQLYMLGGYVTYAALVSYGFGYWPAVAASTAVLALTGIVVERLAFRPLRNQSQINSFISAIGVMMILENGVVVLWGPQGHLVPQPYPGTITIFGIITSYQRLLVIVVAVGLIIALNLFIKKTIFGAAIEAVAQNREGAALMGININRVSAATFAISAAAAGVAASLLAPIFLVSPGMGDMLGMEAFVIVILGGLGSIPGAILGGYILGLIEVLGGGYISADYKDVFAFGALVLVLAFKPTGLFGREEG